MAAVENNLDGMIASFGVLRLAWRLRGPVQLGRSGKSRFLILVDANSQSTTHDSAEIHTRTHGFAS